MNVIVVGGGQVGAYIANLLIENKCKVRIVENRQRVIEKLRREFSEEYIVMGDGADPTVLERAGISEADVVAAVTGADEVNLVTCTIAKFEFGTTRCIARVNNPRNEWLFDSQMGVDVRVNQANFLARLVVDEIEMKNMFTLLKINEGNNSIIQVKVDPASKSVNSQVKDLSIPEDAVLIAVIRQHKVIIPRGDTEILADDNIMVLTSDAAQKTIHQLFGE